MLSFKLQRQPLSNLVMNTAALPFAGLKASNDQSRNPPYIFPTGLKFSKNKTQIKTEVSTVVHSKTIFLSHSKMRLKTTLGLKQDIFVCHLYREFSYLQYTGSAQRRHYSTKHLNDQLDPFFQD